MLDFKSMQPSDAKRLRSVLYSCRDLSCEYSPACLYLWGRARLAECDGFIIPMVNYTGTPIYLRPLGQGDFLPLLPHLIEDSRERGIPFRMNCITEPVREQMEATGLFDFSVNRNHSDYIYPIEALATLAGQKLHAKRNHINRFEENYPGWRTEPITEDNLPECVEMNENWFAERLADGTDPARFDGERRVLREVFSHYNELDMDGLLLRVDDRVVAFSIGNRVTAALYDVNFEKAYSSIQGAYPLINREFARMIRHKYPTVRYLDREDDMGLEGLRRAKLSYHPSQILDKYSATLRGTWR